MSVSLLIDLSVNREKREAHQASCALRAAAAGSRPGSSSEAATLRSIPLAMKPTTSSSDAPLIRFTSSQRPHELAPHRLAAAPDRRPRRGPASGTGSRRGSSSRLDVGVPHRLEALLGRGLSAHRLEERAAGCGPRRAGRPPGRARACSGTARRCRAARCPARLAIAAVLVAWKPWAANSLTAASITCSRRSSEELRVRVSRVPLTAMLGILLIDLSDCQDRRRQAARVEAGASRGAAHDARGSRQHRSRSSLAVALDASARTRTNAPTGAGASSSTDSRVGALPRRQRAIASSSAAASTPRGRSPRSPWWSCLTKKRPSTPPAAVRQLQLQPEQVGLAAAEAEVVVMKPGAAPRAAPQPRRPRSTKCRMPPPR